MKTKIGIAIIISTFIVSLIPYFLIFAIPVFVVGLILLWLGHGGLRTKLGWTFLPIVLWFPGFALLMYLSGTIGTATAQKLDFIFHENFEGRVVIVSNISCGQEVITKDGREQLMIPENGIVLYQGTIQAGYVNHKYYRKDNIGDLIEMPERAKHMYFQSEENPPRTDIAGVWLEGMGTKTSYKPEPTIEYESMTLTVSSKDSIDKYFHFDYLRDFESRTDSLVRACEESKTIHNNH